MPLFGADKDFLIPPNFISFSIRSFDYTVLRVVDTSFVVLSEVTVDRTKIKNSLNLGVGWVLEKRVVSGNVKSTTRKGILGTEG